MNEETKQDLLKFIVLAVVFIGWAGVMLSIGREPEPAGENWEEIR